MAPAPKSGGGGGGGKGQLTVAVVGPSESGKSTLCGHWRLLSKYIRGLHEIACDSPWHIWMRSIRFLDTQGWHLVATSLRTNALIFAQVRSSEASELVDLDRPCRVHLRIALLPLHLPSSGPVQPMLHCI